MKERCHGACCYCRDCKELNDECKCVEMEAEININDRQCPYCEKIYKNAYQVKIHLKNKSCKKLKMICKHKNLNKYFMSMHCDDCGYREGIK